MTTPAPLPWELPLGATVPHPGAVCFRVWAPEADTVAVEHGGRVVALSAVDGVWELTTEGAHGDDYRFLVDGTAWPDPNSRWQPEGLRGPSRVVDPTRLAGGAPRPVLDRDAQVLYELHIGAFTPDGTFDAAIAHLAGLAELGITAIELMPVNEFPGHHGWGYDGIYLGAAQSSYGGPEGLARLVDAAHEVGLAVVLDVVYNHVGPTGGDGLTAFGPYFTDRYQTPWGGAPNLDGPDCGPVREWMLQSAEWWVRDIGLDGLRVDALHALVDGSARHLCAELTDRVRAIHPGALLIAESGLNDPRTIRPTDGGGWGFDADWADDFHHALRTLLTGERDGWYSDYGDPDQLARAYFDPYLFHGQYQPYRRRRFGASASDRDPSQFVVFTQNHDQVGNRPLGDRLPPDVRALAALCLLFSPGTPMLFMGEEYGEPAPFPYFCDHIDPEIATATTEGRRREFADFAGFGGGDVPDPQDPATFASAKLTRQVDPTVLELHRRMLALRRELPPGRPSLAMAQRSVIRVTRGAFELVANLSDESVVIGVGEGGPVVCAGHVDQDESGLVVGPRSGVIVRTTTAPTRRGTAAA